VRRAQDGQALVAALVIMLILFALAGGVAVAASGLLQQSRTRAGSVHDLAAQSAVADVVAQVAGSTSWCTVPTRTGVFPEVMASDSTTLPAAYPDPVNRASTFAACVRMDQVAPTLPSGLSNALPWQSAHCGATPLPVKQRLTIFFDARGPAPGAADGTVYVDDDPVSCWQTLLTSSACSGTSPQPHCLRCGRGVDPGIPVPAQVTLDCDLTSVTTPAYLHVFNPSFQSPARVFTMAHDDAGGSAYLLATHLPPELHAGTDEEEAILYLPQNQADQLLYKGPLP
jgi:hypothetical protein